MRHGGERTSENRAGNTRDDASSRPCLSCAIVSGDTATTGGVLLETAHFHAHQDVAYPVPGLIIVALKRHVRALDELTDEEAVELVRTLRRLRRAQREALGVEHVYYFYNEDTSHHFHVWMVPRYGWMGQFGKSVESVRPALRHAQETMTAEQDAAAVRDAIGRLRDALAH